MLRRVCTPGGGGRGASGLADGGASLVAALVATAAGGEAGAAEHAICALADVAGAGSAREAVAAQAAALTPVCRGRPAALRCN